MAIRLRYICFLLFPSVFQLCLISPVWCEEEGELWMSEVFEIPFLEFNGLGETTLRLENGNRWRDRYSDYYRAHYQGSLIIPIPGMEGWSLEPVYRRQIRNPGDRNQTHTDRYMIQLHSKRENVFGSKWNFSFRNRWEILDNDSSSDQRIRTRFRGKLSKDLECLETAGKFWRFWVSNEVFYNFETDLLSTNRLASGIDIPLSKYSTVSVGYQWQVFRRSHRDHNSEDSHMLLLNYRYKFPKSFFSD